MKPAPYTALLFVDGYNIIGQWDSLKRTRDQYGLEMARDTLVELLIGYSSHQGYHTQVVFDAQYQQSPATQEHPTPHVSVHYTAWLQTADTFIEKRCAHYFRQSLHQRQRVIVATSDRDHQQTVIGYGAEWMSAHALAQSVEQSHLQVKRQQRPPHPRKKAGQGPSRSWVSRLDPAVQDKLSQWRHGLS